MEDETTTTTAPPAAPPRLAPSLGARMADLMAKEAEAQELLDQTGDPTALDAVQAKIAHLLSQPCGEEAFECVHSSMKRSVKRSHDDVEARARAAGAAAVHLTRSGGISGGTARALEKRACREQRLIDEDEGLSDVEDLEAWDGEDESTIVLASTATSLGDTMTLEAHQREGVDFLLERAKKNKGALLAFVMGLGKTRTALAAAHELGIHRIVVLAPSSVVNGWVAEYKEVAAYVGYSCYTPLFSAADVPLRVTPWLKNGGLLVVSYDLLISVSRSRKYRTLASSIQTAAEVLILDELHTVKNLKTKRATVVDSFSTRLRWGLTGTPLSNKPVDFFNIVGLVDRDALGDLTHATFKRDFATPIERGQYFDATPEEKTRARERTAVLRTIFQPTTLHKSDLILKAILPPKTEYMLVYTYDDASRALISGQANDGCYLNMQSIVDRVLRPRKVEIACTILNGMNEGDGTLVFSEHPATLHAIAALYQGCAHVLEGSTPAAQRQAIIESFRLGEVDMLLLSLGAAAVGINCQRANRVLLLDPSENPTRDAQAVCRAWRMGQTQPVTVYRMAAQDTVDVRVLRRGAVKSSVAHSLVHTERINTQFTRADAKTDAGSDAVPLSPAAACPDPHVQALAGVLHGWTSFDAFFADAENDVTDVAVAQNNRNKTINARPRTFVHTDGLTYTANPRQLLLRPGPLAKHTAASAAAATATQTADGEDAHAPSTTTSTTVSVDDIVLAPPPLPIVDCRTDKTVIELVPELRATLSHPPPTLEVSFAPLGADGNAPTDDAAWSMPDEVTKRKVVRKKGTAANETMLVCRSRVVLTGRTGPWSGVSAPFGVRD